MIATTAISGGAQRQGIRTWHFLWNFECGASCTAVAIYLPPMAELFFWASGAGNSPVWAPPCGADEGRQPSQQTGDYPLLPGGGALVLSLSSGLALLSLPLGSSSATKFSGPAAQHPLWTGLRRRRQKAEQADRGLVPSLSSGLGLCSLSLSARRRPPNFSACGAAPAALGWHAAQKAESRAIRPGTTPSFRGGGGWIWSSALAPAWL
jgi:hypothetical protein